MAEITTKLESGLLPSSDSEANGLKNKSSDQDDHLNNNNIKTSDPTKMFLKTDSFSNIKTESSTTHTNSNICVELKKKCLIPEAEKFFKENSKSENGVELSPEERRHFEKIDTLLDGNGEDQHAAYESLKINHEKFSSYGYWWRYAKAAHLESFAVGKNGDHKQQKSLTFLAFSFAEKGLELCDTSSDVHKWYGMTAGTKGEFLGINDRIKNGFIFKQHVDKAVALNPEDYTLHYLLGRFCFEVSKCTWIERTIASTFFSTPPKATIQEALKHFQNAEKVGKPDKSNKLFIAKCYIIMGDHTNVAHWLNSASSLPINSPIDEITEEEIQKLLPKYRKYLSN